MKKGFSLIELLAVVMIVAILSAVALPQYRKAIERARTTEVLTVWGYIERMARAELSAGTLPVAEDKSICDAWYRAAGLTSIGNDMWRGKHFLYYNENCIYNNISMGASRGEQETAYPPSATALYGIDFALTKSGMQLHKEVRCVGQTGEQIEWCESFFKDILPK